MSNSRFTTFDRSKSLSSGGVIPRSARRAFPGFVILAMMSAVFSAPAPSESAGGSYYVDSQSGSDSNSGTSEAAAWRTLAPVRARRFLPGDVVHFKRGSSWTGGLEIDDSGLEGSPITFTTYGTGARPAFSNPGGAGSWTNAVTIRASWVVLEGILTQDAHESGISIPDGSNHNIVRDIEATNVGIGANVYGDSNLVTQSYFHDLHIVVNTPGGDDDYGAVAVVLSGLGNEVSYNRMENCIAPSYDYTVDGGAVEWWAGADGNYVHHNWAKDNNGFMEVGGASAKNTVVAYNVSIDNGDFFYIHLRDQFASVVENFRIENNTIIERSNGESRWVVFGFSDNPAPTTVLMRNNIITVDGFQGVANLWSFTHENNLYDLHNVSEDGFSLGPGELTANPLFVNPLSNDFHLQAASPAIDLGQALGYTLDFEDHPVPAGVAPDLGAYEFGAGAATFADVPLDHPYYDEIEWLYSNGYTAGCSTNPLMYCPEKTMNRAESSVFVERGIHSATYDPSMPAAQVFADLPLDSWAAKWVNGLWVDQYTTGCGTNPLVYCPWQGHTRAEGSVFYLRMLNGATYEPPQPATQTFVDVPLDAWYAKWAQAAYDAGLIPACQTTAELRFCPNDPLMRGLAAYMMYRAKSGPTPTPGGPPVTPPAGYSWVQVWGDEFEGTSVDPSKWKINEYKRSSDLNKTWYRPENVTVANGLLRLEVKNQKYCDPGNASDCANFTGGMLDSYDATSKTTSYRRLFQYGYFEARIRYHLMGPGFWANFWMWGPPFPPEFDHEVLSAYDGEPNPSTVYAAYHYNSATETDLDASTFYPVSYNDQWHTYGYKWLPGEPVQFYLDGTLVFTANATDDLKQNCPDAAQLISLRAGAYYSAYWGGTPDATTQWPGVAEYDWVRVWQTKPIATVDGTPSPP